MKEQDVLEKTNRINLLFDFYESLLTEKQQIFLKYYFQDDYSLGEIAAEFNISRQAVYEHVKRAEFMLEEYEMKLKLAEKYVQRSRLWAEIDDEVNQLPLSQRVALKKLLQHVMDVD